MPVMVMLVMVVAEEEEEKEEPAEADCLLRCRRVVFVVVALLVRLQTLEGRAPATAPP